jgi:hypothetical protein
MNIISLSRDLASQRMLFELVKLLMLYNLLAARYVSFAMSNQIRNRLWLGMYYASNDDQIFGPIQPFAQSYVHISL